MTIIEQNTMYAIQEIAREMRKLNDNIGKLITLLTPTDKDVVAEKRAEMKATGAALMESIRRCKVNA